ncbi:MAG: creatininase family protein [Desulfobacterales bacterium]|jgi:creatinine amidohydrolase/Fe(II)-dependent formamide hydrolase-like protein
MLTKKPNEPKQFPKQPDSEKDPLAALEVFDRLTVGPIKIEPKRLIAPYRLVWEGGEESIDLIYRYEERVFKPEEPESQNLASMMAVQVALNYGLFCRSLVFHGMFDNLDRKFIKEMAENTAREIYVKKFLEPNPFLVSAAAQLPAVKKSRYLRSKIEFPQMTSAKPQDKWRLWSTSNNSHGILSSGGKDSLLTFGLLDETAREVHPIFVNESGRHWFTALNAHRYFKRHVSNTTRVWVNSDRLFVWMLKHMPFIRKDFADIRSDEYPIRLWTVAIFLFGVLPVIRMRGIGRIIIGDEFDTTVRSSHKGIRHYNGLYDQSLHFDNALSRYYLQKGWSVSQFSILRPLSELLIEKILYTRYPHLQEHQVSCHAAHEKEGRIYPCGKCEKCRRIVSMLMAIDAEPGTCGYTEQQIDSCLKAFADKGIHQEEAEKAHLTYLLQEKGLIEIAAARDQKISPRPEILKLRFDPGRSPLEAIPVDLRKPLFEIFLEHAGGALKRDGRSWIAFDPLTDASLGNPYPFEMEASTPESKFSDYALSSDDRRYLWGEITWPEAKVRLQKTDIALLPVGSIEQHGPHLPLDTDAFDADYLAKRVAAVCSSPKPLVLPLISYGVSYHHEDFAGTISIDNDTLSRLVYDVGMSVARNGIKKMVIINGHGGNSPALNYAAQMINRDAHIFVCVDTGETSDVDINKIVETPNDVHSGETETSTSLAVRPHLVRMDKARKSVPAFSSRYLNFTGKRSIAWYASTRKISASGIMGDPTKASAEKGEKIWEIMIAHLVALVEDLKGMTLKEIFHKRY